MNEYVVFDENSPVAADSGIVVKLKDSSGNEIGTTANPEVGKINENGTFSIRTNHLDSNYTVSLQLPDGLKVTKNTGTTDPTSSGTDMLFAVPNTPKPLKACVVKVFLSKSESVPELVGSIVPVFFVTFSPSGSCKETV